MPSDLQISGITAVMLGVRDLPQSVVTVGLPSAYEIRAPVEGGNRPSSASRTPAFCTALLYSIILSTASALGTPSGAANS